MKDLKTQFQDRIKKEYAKYWDRSIIDFLIQSTEETAEDNGNIFYDLLSIKFGNDVITLEGVSKKVLTFDFAVRVHSQEFGWTNSSWEILYPQLTLKDFTLGILPDILDEYEKECVKQGA